MNYDKLYLKRLFNTKDISLLTKVKPEMFKYAMAKSTIKLLKGYVKKHGVIPTIEVFNAVLSSAMAADKAEIYSAYLTGLELIEADITVEAVLDGLKAQYVLSATDDAIEELVSASAEKDTDRVKELIRELSATLNVHEKTPEAVKDTIYQPSNIRMIKPFLPSMVERGMLFGGLTIIGAGTGAGKSVFLINQLLYSYKVENLNVCLLNLELGADETMARMYSCATETPFEEVFGNDTPKMVGKVTAWKENYFGEDHKFTMKNIRFDVEEIVEIIRQQASLGVTVFGVDYLQLVDSSSQFEEWKALRDLVRALHTLTLELGITILSPVQINVSDVEEGDGELKISVRGSRELENSATAFLFIYQNKEEYKEDVARIFTVKARNARKYTYVTTTNFGKMKFEDTGIIL